MDMYKLKLTRLQNEIFRLLCIKAGTPINQRGVARMLRVSPTAIAKSIPKLEEEGLIKAQKSNSMNFISLELNRDNPKAIALKRLENLRLVYESGLSDFLAEMFPGCTIILFGSYAQGEDTTKSDIDIAVIGCSPRELVLRKFFKMLERYPRLHFYNRIASIDKNLRANILSGITLQGMVEL